MRDVFVAVVCAPAGSPLAAATDKRAAWNVTDALLATVVDQLNGLTWQLGGGKGPQPKPVPRPWVEREEQTFRGDPMTTAEADELAARFRRGHHGD